MRSNAYIKSSGTWFSLLEVDFLAFTMLEALSLYLTICLYQNTGTAGGYF